MNSPFAKSSLVVLSTGRSGTAFTSKLLCQFGLDIGHETLGEDGISSWYMTDSESKAGGVSWHELEGRNILVGHQLRNPFKTIPSLMTINKSSWRFIRNSAITSSWDTSLLKRSMRHWLEWNQAAWERADFHWSLEEIETEMKPFVQAAIPDIDDQMYKSVVNSFSVPVNSSKSRALDLSRMLQTSPVIYARRLRQAFFPVELSLEKMHAADSVLAQDIDAFYTEFKATVRFKRGLWDSRGLQTKPVTTELQRQLNSEDKSVAE